MSTFLLSIIDSAADCPSKTGPLPHFISSFIHSFIQSKYPLNCLHFSLLIQLLQSTGSPQAFTWAQEHLQTQLCYHVTNTATDTDPTNKQDQVKNGHRNGRDHWVFARLTSGPVPYPCI